MKKHLLILKNQIEAERSENEAKNLKNDTEKKKCLIFWLVLIILMETELVATENPQYLNSPRGN